MYSKQLEVMEKQKVYVVNFLEVENKTFANVICEGVVADKETAINECKKLFESILNDYINNKDIIVFKQNMKIKYSKDKFTFYDSMNSYYAELSVVEKVLEYK